MTPQEASTQFGATHYTVMADGKTPQMYYRQEDIHFNDGTSKRVWAYLSFANIWMGSGYPLDVNSEAYLKEIV